MTRRSFFDDTMGISVMYDAVFFLVMVSLAGALLLPVASVHGPLKSIVDKHREDVVDDALHMFLVSRSEVFSYRFCGTLVDSLAHQIGINITDHGLYNAVTDWLLAHEQRHKTYATLLAENLGCQFLVPFSVFGMNRLNIFTEEYDSQLQNDTMHFFSTYLGDKYRFNLTAWWHPIKAVSFGGEFSVGSFPPLKDCYVAESFCMMPYSPVICVGNQTFILTKQWVKQNVFGILNGSALSCIPVVTNITTIFEQYSNSEFPFDTKKNASRALHENLSDLVGGFLIYGIVNETNASVFPGIVTLAMNYGFQKVKQSIGQGVESVLDDVFGGAVRSIDGLFDGLNTSVTDPLSSAILMQLNTSLHGLLNESFSSLDATLDACEIWLKELLATLLQPSLDALLSMVVEDLLDAVDSILDAVDLLIDWLFDQFCLNRAEVRLIIWTVRE